MSRVPNHHWPFVAERTKPMPTPEPLRLATAAIIKLRMTWGTNEPPDDDRQMAQAALKAHAEWLAEQGLVVRKDSSGEMHRMVSQTYDGEIGWGDEG